MQKFYKQMMKLFVKQINRINNKKKKPFNCKYMPSLTPC